MDKFLQIVGWLAALSIGAYVAVALATNGIGGAGQAFVWGFPGILASIVLAAFGSMLGTLRDIRSESASQTDLLRRFITKV